MNPRDIQLGDKLIIHRLTDIFEMRPLEDEDVTVVEISSDKTHYRLASGHNPQSYAWCDWMSKADFKIVRRVE
jgi:hypothetical protein